MKENTMCKACRAGKLYNREVTQKFERDGLEVSIEGIPALVCDRCSQVYFPAGIGDKISDAANHLFLLSEFKHIGEYKATV
jgi:YgiT-type zinc finger domain-containing protein